MSAARGSLGETIRARRLELGISQEELAERISADDQYVRQSEISRIENGRVLLPRRQRLELIAAALGLSLGDLLARSGWAGADEAFDHHPSLREVRPLENGGTERVIPRRRRARNRQAPHSPPAVQRAQIGGAAAAREQRLRQMRAATREIQTTFQRGRREIVVLRGQFAHDDLMTGTS